MKRLHGRAIFTALLAWVILAGSSNAAALQNGDKQELENSRSATILASRSASGDGFLPKAAVLPPSTRLEAGQIDDKGQEGKSDSRDAQLPNQALGTWQFIVTEGFEGVFPFTNWTVRDLNYDPCQLCWGAATYWDGTAYRAHSGSFAAWPATGGTNGYPPSSNNNYANNMNTRMIYGPIDLSNAGLAHAEFYLWREIESSWDYVAFEASHTGNDNDFQELARWDASVQQWEFKDVYFNSYVGDDSVWVAWRFYSDSTVTYQGPWVDDIRISKYVPGQVTAQGTFSYIDRDGVTSRRARFTKVYLYDQDLGGVDDLLATTTTDANGFFAFPPITNWDSDDTDLDPSVRRLDPYVVWETDYNDSGLARRRVTNFDDQPYRWPSFTSTNALDVTIDFSTELPAAWPNLEALWMFQDLRRAWEYVAPTSDPGSGTVRWEVNQNCFEVAPLIAPCNASFFWPNAPLAGVFIASNQRESSDVLIHELGHEYMYNTRGSFWYSLDTWNDFDQCAIQGHGMFDAKTQLCAWTEGWGDFLPLVVNQDPCYDFDRGPCTGIADQRYYNLETHGRNDDPQTSKWGDTVEGRVAGALYDLFDSANEPPWYDNGAFGFAPIWTIVRSAPHESGFRQFWDSWTTSGNNKHRAVQAVYQNTIDYDTAPVVSGLPDRTLLQDTTWKYAIELWPYSHDPESTASELGWQIVNATDIRCGVSLESNRYVNLAPQRGWFGFCDATLSVSDGIKTGTDVFRVNVAQVRARLFSPIIFR